MAQERVIARLPPWFQRLCLNGHRPDAFSRIVETRGLADGVRHVDAAFSGCAHSQVLSEQERHYYSPLLCITISMHFKYVTPGADMLILDAG